MGTNYYLPKACPNPCDHCSEEGLHIGKRSAGWTFGFQAYPDESLMSWEAWKERIRTAGKVVDEYGDEFTPEEFESLVLETLDPWGPRRLTPRHRDALTTHSGYDDRRFYDAEGWDFWIGDFS